MNDPAITVTRSQRTLSAGEQAFWGPAPLVGPTGSAPARGHVRAEVWDDGFVCLSMSDPSLMSPALAALMGVRPLAIPSGVLPDQPLMTEHAEAAFLGRVSIDFPEGTAPVVGACGSDGATLVSLVVSRLRQLS